MIISEMDVYKSNSNVVNDDMDRKLKELRLPKKDLQLDTAEISSAKDVFSKAKNSQQKYVRAYEKDKKKYKILKRYGEVLQLVEKLLGLVPGNVDNLSIEELTKKLEELMKSRKRNMDIMAFSFYQSVISNLLTDLIAIEKEFQEGKITSKQAFESVQKAKAPIKEHYNDMPPVLFPAVKEASHLVKTYESSYSTELTEEETNESTSLTDTNIKPRHKYLMDKLHEDTRQMLTRVSNLDMRLNQFVPQVDLGGLTKDLQSTEKLLENPDFSVSEMESAVTKLEGTTVTLTDKQVNLNIENKALQTEIEDCTAETTKLNSLSTQHFTRETFIAATERAEQTRTNVDEIEELIEVADTMPTDIATQFADTMIEQLEADDKVSTLVAKDPNADQSFAENDINDIAQDELYDLKDKVLTIEEKREMILKLEKLKNNNDDSDENK